MDTADILGVTTNTNNIRICSIIALVNIVVPVAKTRRQVMIVYQAETLIILSGITNETHNNLVHPNMLYQVLQPERLIKILPGIAFMLFLMEKLTEGRGSMQRVAISSVHSQLQAS